MSNFYVRQRAMTPAQTLVVLRRLHAAECAINPKKQHEPVKHEAKTEPTKAGDSKPKEQTKAAEQTKTAPKATEPKHQEAKSTEKPSKSTEKVPKRTKPKDTKTTEEKQAIAKKRAALEDLLVRKFFYVPSFEIYGGIGGLYDYGPTGCAMKANLLALWRQHFVLTENMLEVSCTALTPEVVLKTSGHVDKFTDYMVKDSVTGDCHRADKILEDHLEAMIDGAQYASPEEKAEILRVKSAAGALSQADLGTMLKKYNVLAPDTENEIGEPFPFNLMFQTMIGPSGKFVGYLRPETAQGIFVNFKRLLEYNGGRMPFAAAQIGVAFRNEIAPRSGLLRVREFEMAEIEHFVHKDQKQHPRFAEVADLKLQLLSRDAQEGDNIPRLTPIGEAVRAETVDNETLGYFMARTHLFLISVGIIPERLRFRQHQKNEMAHYAKDCWDAEILMSYGWIECVGIADRAAYDLEVHSLKSKTELVAQHVYDPPQQVEVATVWLDKAKLGKQFKDKGPAVMAYLNALEKEPALALGTELSKGPASIEVEGKTYTIQPEMVKVTLESKKISVLKYIPSVIEPSFGVGRCLYGILEHSHVEKEKQGPKGVEVQSMIALKPLIAPYKVGICPFGSEAQQGIASYLEDRFVDTSFSTKTDSSGASIGKKYARMDEIGIPFAIAVDFDSETDGSVTIRDRDSTQQIRVDKTLAPDIVVQLVRGEITWAHAHNTYPKFERPGEKEEKE
jgi:glycyl-tRNA synthetase